MVADGWIPHHANVITAGSLTSEGPLLRLLLQASLVANLQRLDGEISLNWIWTLIAQLSTLNDEYYVSVQSDKGILEQMLKFRAMNLVPRGRTAY